MHYAVRQILGVAAGVGMRDPHQYEQARPDLPHGLASYFYVSFLYALDDKPQVINMA